MGSFNFNWETVAQIIGTTDGYVTLSGTTPSNSSDIDFETSGEFGAHVIVEVNFDSTPTNYVDVKLYGSLDGSNYADTPYATRRIDKATDPNQIDVPLDGRFAHHIVSVVQTGSTDSHDVRAYIQKYTGESA
jgi:hypothetical protein